MDWYIQFTGKTAGRDKVYRTLQYACKLLGWSLDELNYSPHLIENLSKLESHASTGRKFFRLGKSVDCIRSAQSSIHLLDPFLRTVLTINHLNRAGFLLIDHYLWLGKTGWKTVDQKWEFQSARFYLATIMLSIIRDLYALHLTAIQLANARRNDKDQAGSAPPVQKLHKALSANVPATLDLVKNLFDFVIPATKLGYIPGKHNGVLGFCGLMSSLIGAYQIARPEIKLKPN